MGILVGTGLAIANARADLSRDAASGVGSVAVTMGDRRSWLANVVALLAALGLAMAWLLAAEQGSAASWILIGAGGALLVVGLVLGRGSSSVWRERGWQAQAVGVAAVAVGWVAAVALPGA
jgi:4-hydroxybenzoate polyprenyltransferase